MRRRARERLRPLHQFPPRRALARQDRRLDGVREHPAGDEARVPGLQRVEHAAQVGERRARVAGAELRQPAGGLDHRAHALGGAAGQGRLRVVDERQPGVERSAQARQRAAAADRATAHSGCSVSRATRVASCAAARPRSSRRRTPRPRAADERRGEQPVAAAGAQALDRVVADHDAAVERADDARIAAATRSSSLGNSSGSIRSSQPATSGPCSSGATSASATSTTPRACPAGARGRGRPCARAARSGTSDHQARKATSAAPATRARRRRPRSSSIRSRWASNHAGSGARRRESAAARRGAAGRRGASASGARVGQQPLDEVVAADVQRQLGGVQQPRAAGGLVAGERGGAARASPRR